MSKYIILLLALLTTLSCTEKETILSLENEQAICAIWKRTNVEREYANKEHEELAKQFPMRVEKDYFVNIFPDGKGTVIYNTEIDAFEWQIKNNQEGNETTSASMSLNDSELRLVSLSGDTLLQLTTDNGYTKMYFEKESGLTTNFNEDPSYPDNNFWRIRALEPISDSEIKAKVDNYLQHYKLLFKASLDKNNPRPFTNKHTQGILRIYQSAIGVVSRDQISEDWYSFFYNNDEAIRAYEILKQKIEASDTKIEKTDDWVADNYRILEKIMDKQD